MNTKKYLKHREYNRSLPMGCGPFRIGHQALYFGGNHAGPERTHRGGGKTKILPVAYVFAALEKELKKFEGDKKRK